MHHVDHQAESRNPGSDAGLPAGIGSRSRRSMVAVCSWCHKARDKRGNWTRVHCLLLAHPELTQTHGICPECLLKHFPNRVSVA
jgi:hypothetical protein